jgi:hypothetical protein
MKRQNRTYTSSASRTKDSGEKEMGTAVHMDNVGLVSFHCLSEGTVAVCGICVNALS